MKKNYQKNAAFATAPVLPEAVSVVIVELAEDVREGLLAMAVGAGLPVMAAMMDADVEAVCGPKGKHDPRRAAVRHGVGDGPVSLGGRRVRVTRPRMRATDGSWELAVDSSPEPPDLPGRSVLKRPGFNPRALHWFGSSSFGVRELTVV